MDIASASKLLVQSSRMKKTLQRSRHVEGLWEPRGVRPDPSIISRPLLTLRRIPTLDGWRGIAILLVIFAHWQAGTFQGHAYHDWLWLSTGLHGVAIFFVLSGYLITSRLFCEDSLSHFYFRRIFRLWPVAWAYLAVLFAFGLLWKSEVVACLLFYRNFFATPADKALSAHFWSLSVEEQFYLAWPPILFLARRRAGKIVALGIAGFSVFPPAWPYAALLIGCALAFVAKKEAFRQWIREHHHHLFPVSLVVFCACEAACHEAVPILELLAIATMLACSSIKAYRWLEWKTLAEIGVYSYSLYVWQEVFVTTHLLNGAGIGLLPIVAIGSYHFIERPCIELGTRIYPLGQNPFHLAKTFFASRCLRDGVQNQDFPPRDSQA